MADNAEEHSMEESKKELDRGNQECQQLAEVCQSISEAADAIAAQPPPPADSDVAVTSSPATSTRSDDVTAERSPEADVDELAGETGPVHAPAPVNRNGNYRISSEEMNLAEMKVKIVCQEKNNMALRMELKCAELQVAAKEKIDTKKTRLIELLDAKLSGMEKKNAKLLDMMEGMMKDREQHTKRLVDATKNMEELGRKLTDSERMKRELVRINGELKAMLDSVEGKGTKLATMAKEKVLKYKVENERMQKEIEDMKLDAASASPATSAAGGGAELWVNLEAVEELGRQLSAHIESAAKEPSTDEPTTTSLSEAGRVCGELCGSLDLLRQAAVDVVAISSRAVDLDVQNAELVKKCEQMEQKAAAAATAVPAVGPAAGEAAEAAERQTTVDEVRKKELEAKDAEIAVLTDELHKLKSAIGQLVGLNTVTAAK